MSRFGELLHHSVLNLKRVFHLFIALVFMVLTVSGAMVTFEEWREYQLAPQAKLTFYTMLGFGAFTVFLAILCLYTFAKAKSVR